MFTFSPSAYAEMYYIYSRVCIYLVYQHVRRCNIYVVEYLCLVYLHVRRCHIYIVEYLHLVNLHMRVLAPTEIRKNL